MFEKMRRIFGPVAVSAIIGSIAVVFIFFGIYNPKTNGGASSGSAAEVNGESISMEDFGREYQRRIDFYQNMMKGKIDPAMLEQFGLRTQVVEELVRRKLLSQEAERQKVTVSDEELRTRIAEMPYFKPKGSSKFDPAQYEAVLKANRMTPAKFEQTMREDLNREQISALIRTRAFVSPKELEDEYLLSENKRSVDYVLIGRDTVQKLVKITDAEIDTFLKSAENVKVAEERYEQSKNRYVRPLPKGKKPAKDEPVYLTFSEVKEKVARELLAEKQFDNMSKLGRSLANQALEAAKKSRKDLESFAKSNGLTLKTTPKFNNASAFIPEVGEWAELVEDAFRTSSPLKTAPKSYEYKGAFLIATNLVESQANMSNFEKDKEKLTQDIRSRKERALFEQWMQELRSKAKVTINKAITAKAE